MCGTDCDCMQDKETGDAVLGPVCCDGKPCGDTCISADEVCHEGEGTATCSTNKNCRCNSCDNGQVCYPACECGNAAAGSCSSGSCGNCCDDATCPKHGEGE